MIVILISLRLASDNVQNELQGRSPLTIVPRNKKTKESHNNNNKKAKLMREASLLSSAITSFDLLRMTPTTDTPQGCEHCTTL